jgi:hypothetical protein
MDWRLFGVIISVILNISTYFVPVTVEILLVTYFYTPTIAFYTIIASGVIITFASLYASIEIGKNKNGSLMNDTYWCISPIYPRALFSGPHIVSSCFIWSVANMVINSNHVDILGLYMIISFIYIPIFIVGYFGGSGYKNYYVYEEIPAEKQNPV